jgi:hypothetical protein
VFALSIEAINFQRRNAKELDKLARLLGSPIEILCAIPILAKVELNTPVRMHCDDKLSDFVELANADKHVIHALKD